MKSMLFISLSLCLSLVLVGCQSNSQPKNESNPATTQAKDQSSQDNSTQTASGETAKQTALDPTDPEYYLKQFAQKAGKSPSDLTDADFLKVIDYTIGHSNFPSSIIYDLSFVGQMKNLKTLKINVAYQSPDFFNSLTHLQTLSLYNPTLTGYPNKELPDFSHLTTLTDVALKKEGLERLDVLKPLKNLKALNLTGNNVQDLSELKEFPRLESLNLRDNPLLHALDGIQVATHLKTLVLSGDTAVAPMDLKYLHGLKNLEDLTVSDTSVIDDLSGADFPHLKFIGLINVSISTLNFLKDASDIQSVNIRGSNISDLSVLKNKKALHDIDIRRTRVDSVAPLKDLPNLKYLMLDKNMTKDWTLLKDKKGLEISGTSILG